MDRLRPLFVVFALAILAGAAIIVASDDRGESDWPMIGNDSANSRNQPFEQTIGRRNVDRLLPKWTATTTGDVSGTPAVANGAVYFGDFGGTLWKLDAETGDVIWSHGRGGLHRSRGRLRTHEPIARWQHAHRRRHQGHACRSLRSRSESVPEHAGHRCQDRRTAMVGAHPRGSARRDDRIADAGRQHGDHRHLRQRRGRRHVDVPRCDRGAQRADGTDPLARLFGPGASADQRNSGLCRGDDVLAACSGSRRGLVYGTFGQAYHVPASVTDCHTKQGAAHGGFDESCELPGAFWKSIVAFDLQSGQPRWSYRMNRSHGLCAEPTGGGHVVRSRQRRREMGPRWLWCQRDAAQTTRAWQRRRSERE